MLRRCVHSRDFAQYVPYRLTKSSEHLDWRGFRVEVVRGHTAGEIALPPLDHHLLNLIVAVPTLHEHRWGGLQRQETAQEGAAALVPAGQESYWRWKYLAEGTPCDIHVHLDPAFVRRAAVASLDQLPPDVELRANLCFYNPTVRQIAHLLLEEVERDGINGPLYAESIATSLVASLLKAQGPWSAESRTTRTRVAADRLRLVCDYIEANLSAPLHLEQLSEIAGLGPDRFGELFRARVGVSPHRYVLQRKIEHGKLLLKSKGSSITDIACRLGFADHAHFSATFRRLTGVTPSRFRGASAP